MKSNKPKSKAKWIAQKVGKQNQQKRQKAEGPSKQLKSKQPNSYIYGKHATEAAVRHQRRKVEEILHATPLTPAQQKLFQNYPTKLVEKKELDALFPNAVHQNIIAIVGDLPIIPLEDVYDAKLILALDQVTDPHNLGAILRSADAFGVSAVLIPKAGAAPITEVTTKTAAGAVETVPVIEVNLAQALEKLKAQGFWSIGLAGSAKQTLGEIPKFDKTVLVMGSEGKGLRPLVQKTCDHLAKLPMKGTVESLNVSVANGIALYELNLP